MGLGFASQRIFLQKTNDFYDVTVGMIQTHILTVSMIQTHILFD